MATTTKRMHSGRQVADSEQRIILRNIDWATYRHIADAQSDRPLRMAYNRGILEIMSPSPAHECFKVRLREFIGTVARLLGIPYMALASTTWDRPESERAIEADECYIFAAEKLAIAIERPPDIVERLAPDLAVEIDLRRSSVGRAEIYATLAVPEVWRFDGQTLVIDRLGLDGSYEAARSSLFLPITPDDIVPWILNTIFDDLAWSNQVRDWVRARVPSSFENGL
jgi:Uma2 family endonuclease